MTMCASTVRESDEIGKTYLPFPDCMQIFTAPDFMPPDLILRFRLLLEHPRLKDSINRSKP
ncbi:hypothetical protein PGT21_034077 [Puccinia graminis f. sp. tritici]|uniref:Uncharacterized protein n=1 Tax=Puccinia graminis f. sp. tritici TaxID=56615 RepID=A0A5B0PCJ3_PUCGR|nr:hypothetical protein PGT21_034077 [Puccinia graminis f. sp. tritici]KAA1125629.1 hypothetical protein PGTUg99_013742 [Puccinia graminis f. sp. tritici]